MKAFVVITRALGFAHCAGGACPSAQAPKAAAPIDLTGYWVSIVSEDWRYRMVTPTKGDYQGVPVTPDAVKIAEAWNPDADTAAGNQCRSYGAPAIMRVPGRVHITWDDDKTLKLDADAGTQTRVFRFEKPATKKEASWQGDSVAEWDMQPGGRGAAANAPRRGSLKVVTTNLKSGYLRKNGIPVQRRGEADGILRRHPRPQRRRAADGHDGRRRSEISAPAVHRQHAVQEAS